MPKFIIETASEFGENIKTLTFAGAVYRPPFKAWVIELESIEALLALSEKLGRGIVLKKHQPEAKHLHGMRELIIYDDYLE